MWFIIAFYLSLSGDCEAHWGEQEGEGGAAAQERGLPGRQEPQQDQKDEEAGSCKTWHSWENLVVIFFSEIKMSRSALLDPGIDLTKLSGRFTRYKN